MLRTSLVFLIGVLALTSSFAYGAKNVKISVSKLTDYLIEGDYDSFVTALDTKDFSVDKSDSAGRQLVIEAVKYSRISFLDILLQHRVNVNKADPVTGETALQKAFQKGSVPLARLLLSYGASPDVVDKTGSTARNFVPSEEIGQLLSLYDKDGAMAFEDRPGVWTRYENVTADGKRIPYYHNEETENTRWNVPPSCAWRRYIRNNTYADVQSGKALSSKEPYYANLVTLQQVDFIPPAVAWTRVRTTGSDQPHFYNWRVNISRIHPPAELSEEDLASLMKAPINRHWYSHTTDEIIWVDPESNPRWRKFHDEEHDRDFYLDVFTGESSWEAPVELSWEEAATEEGAAYFYNSVTGQSHWEKPDVWTVVEKDEL